MAISPYGQVGRQATGARRTTRGISIRRPARPDIVNVNVTAPASKRRGRVSKYVTTKMEKYGVEPWQVGVGLGAAALLALLLWPTIAGATPNIAPPPPPPPPPPPGGLPAPPPGATRLVVTQPPNSTLPGINIRSAPMVPPGASAANQINRVGGARWGQPINVLGQEPNGWLRVQVVNSDNGAVITGYACNTCPENTDGVPYIQ